MYQPLIKFHPHPAIITQVLCIFAKISLTNNKIGKNLFITDKYLNVNYIFFEKIPPNIRRTCVKMAG